MSLIHIDTYFLDGERTLLLGKTTNSDGGGVTESLAGELSVYLPVGMISMYP